MEYKKKSYFVLLSTLLLTFLLGLSGNAYATEFSDNELKNIFYNSLTNFGQHDTDVVRNALDSFDFSPWNLTEDYSYTTIYCAIQENDLVSSNRYLFYIYYNNDETKKSQLGYNYCKAYYNIQYKNGVVSKYFGNVLNSSTYIQQNGHAYDYMVRYNDLDIYNGAGNTVVVPAGWHPSNIDEGVYNDIIWQLSTRNDNLYKIYPDSTQNYHLISSAMAVELGTLTNSQYADTISYQFIGYNSNNGQFNYQYPVKYIFRYKYNGQIFNYLNGVTTNNNGVYSTRLLVDTQNYGNCILILTIKPDNTDLQTITEYYYIDTNKTYTANGWIYPTNTFSGDYENQYNQQQQTNEIIGNNQDNTQQVIDTITDDSQVQDGLDNFTNSSGDLLNNFGYSPIDNPFYAVIDYVLNSVKDVLLGSGNVTLNVGWHGYNTFLHSQDFTLPNNAVVTLIHLICNGFFIWGLYKYGFKLYQWINSGRIQNLVNEANDHQYYWF